MFPCFDDIVGVVPALERSLSLGGLEHPTGGLADAYGIEAQRDRHSSSPPRLAGHRAVP